MERANGNLQRSHGSNQMNHMVRLIPVGINQRVNTTASQHQVVINLVAVNIILLTMPSSGGEMATTSVPLLPSTLASKNVTAGVSRNT